MQDIEPYYGWRDIYTAEEDDRSPFYKKKYDELYYTNKLYNFLIHPQWDNIGSPTLFIKILFVNYEKKLAVIELLGEWNDAIHNDIMHLKRNVIDPLLEQGIKKFALIGENILNYHRGDIDYYEEWFQDIKDEGGWIFALNFEPHVIAEMSKRQIFHYLSLNAETYLNWRVQSPFTFHKWLEQEIQKSISD